MFSEKQYYQKLYDLLIYQNKDIFERCLNHPIPVKLEPPDDPNFRALEDLLGQVERNYGFDMHLNYRQLALWQLSFLPRISPERILAAGKMVQFCCLIDHFLDSPRFSAQDKDAVCTRIQNFFAPHALKPDVPFVELDLLAQDIRLFYAEKRDPIYSDLKRDIQDAFSSEEYMYRSVLEKKLPVSDEELAPLVDKSILFEKAVFLTAAYGDNTPDMLRAAELMGKLFWLVDDLCDLIDDVHAGRKNSLLFYCPEKLGSVPLTERLEQTYLHLDRAVDCLVGVLKELKKLISEDMFAFMIVQIWNWCHHVREMAD